MNLQSLNFKKLREHKKVILPLCLIGIFLLHTTFVFGEKDKTGAPGALLSPGSGTNDFLDAESSPPDEKKAETVSTNNGSRRRIFKRIPTLPFRDDEVHDIRLGYGMHIQLELPEKIKTAVPPDERLVSLDYVDDRVYLKGIAYAVGEITNATVITESGKSLHLFIRIVEPTESDQGFKFFVPSKNVFSESHVKKEVQKATKEKEQELEKREGNLEQVTEKLAEDRLKQKLLHEENTQKKVRVKEDALEIKDVQVTRLGARIYVKFTLHNRSKQDFTIGTMLLGRGITDPKNADKVLGVEDLQTDSPTFDSELIPKGSDTKILLAFDARQVHDVDKVVLKVVEEGGACRAIEFKNLKLFAR